MATISIIIAAIISPNYNNPSMPTITPPAVSIDIPWGGLSGNWNWSSGAGPGMTLGDVTPSTWQLDKPETNLSLNGFISSSGFTAGLWVLNNWGTTTSDPNINDNGTGTFAGSSDDMPGQINWFITNIF
jgi:hypothetical protein